MYIDVQMLIMLLRTNITIEQLLAALQITVFTSPPYQTYISRDLYTPPTPAVDKRNLRYRIGPGSNPANISKTEASESPML